MLQIYWDLAVLLNFLVDFLLILGTNRLAGFPMQPGRSAAAAGLGSAYAAGCLMPGFQFLAGNLWRMVCLWGMAGVAFGWNRGALKRGGVFLLLSMALGGIALCFGSGRFTSVLLAAAGVWALCQIAFGETVGGRKYVPLEIRWGGACVKLTALVDSGNTLRDPLTGEQVLVIGPAAAEKLTGLTRQQLRTPIDTLSQRTLPGLRLVPYRSVGQAEGMMLAMRFGDVTIGKRRRGALVAFAPDGLGEGKQYQALTGGTL